MTLEELQKQVDALLYREFLRSGISLETTIAFVKNSKYNLGDLLVSIDVNEETPEISVKRIVDKVLENIADIKTKKSLRQEVVDNLTNVILRGKPVTSTVGVKQLKSSSGKFQSIDQYVAEHKALKDLKGRYTTKAKFAEEQKSTALRDLKGSFTSVTKLALLMQAALKKTVADNMFLPALQYKTGRFAGSVKLTNLQYDNRAAELTAYLTYMKYPYQTFEPGYKQGMIPERDPRILIGESAREVAMKLTKTRMKVVHV
jgi:hypothetical protein